MKLLDQNTSEHFHVPTVVLMEQAAVSFVQELIVYLNKKDKILIVCGNGNNGADGIAVARLLNQKGYKASIYFIKDKGSELYNLQKLIYKEYDFDVTETISDEYDVYIDAIFGIGLSRNISGQYQEIIDTINSFSGIKVAIDMPSGIDANGGKVLGVAFKADYTITFSFLKLGQLLWPGNEYCGKNIVAPMGITKDSFLENTPSYAYLEEKDKKLLPERKAHSNKGTYGKLLIVAGSNNMAGAAYLSAKAAYRTGVGLVKILTCTSNRAILQNLIPEAIIETYDENIDFESVKDNLKWADAVVVGPGIGKSSQAIELVRLVLSESDIPILLDADALNIIAEDIELLKCNKEIIVTPHLGEMSRLTGCSVKNIQDNLVRTASEFSYKYSVVCVLKDFHTIISSPGKTNYVNLNGNNGMATAGSGDVLTGIIGAFLASKIKIDFAAAMGVYIHGEAGDNIFHKTGTYGMMASDIIEGIKVI